MAAATDARAAAPAAAATASTPATGPGAPFLAQASQKWDGGELDLALPLYEQALEAGGLGPQDVVLAYARVGTYQAALGKPDMALSYFRLCAAIDPGFKLPSESGPKAEQLYQKARTEADAIGGKLEVTVSAPTDVAKGTKFEVVARIPEGFAPLAEKVAIEVREPVSGKVWRSSLPTEPELKFEVPPAIVAAGSTLSVRVLAVDSHQNRYASADTRVKVKGRAAPVTANAWGGVSPDDEDELPAKEDSSPKAWYFSGPWPYLLGGAVLVGGAIGVYAATRPSNEATVGAPRWQ